MEKKGRERKSSVRGRMREGRREKGRERVCGTKGERGREREGGRERQTGRDGSRWHTNLLCHFLLWFVLAL